MQTQGLRGPASRPCPRGPLDACDKLTHRSPPCRPRHALMFTSARPLLFKAQPPPVRGHEADAAGRCQLRGGGGRRGRTAERIPHQRAGPCTEMHLVPMAGAGGAWTPHLCCLSRLWLLSPSLLHGPSSVSRRTTQVDTAGPQGQEQRPLPAPDAGGSLSGKREGSWVGSRDSGPRGERNLFLPTRRSSPQMPAAARAGCWHSGIL